jgi:hypothetical protein
VWGQLQVMTTHTSTQAHQQLFCLRTPVHDGTPAFNLMLMNTLLPVRQAQDVCRQRSQQTHTLGPVHMCLCTLGH